MAKAGEDRYFKGSGDSFYKMEHFDIEDMFGRRKKPKLSLFTVVKSRVQSQDSLGKTYEGAIIVGIKNTGRGIGRYIYFALSVNPPYRISHHGLDVTSKIGWNSLWSSEQSVRYFGDANLVIHPNLDLEITVITHRFRENINKIEDLVIKTDISAEEMRLVHKEKTILGDDIISKAKSKD
jgi:hypothetical protein